MKTRRQVLQFNYVLFRTYLCPLKWQKYIKGWFLYCNNSKILHRGELKYDMEIKRFQIKASEICYAK